MMTFVSFWRLLGREKEGGRVTMMCLWTGFSSSSAKGRQKALTKAWEDMRQSDVEHKAITERNKSLVLQNIKLDPRCFYFLKHAVSVDLAEPRNRLRVLQLHEIRVLGRDEDRVANDLTHFLLLNKASLRELALEFSTTRWGWTRKIEKNVFIKAIQQQGPSLKNLCKISFKNVHLCGEDVVRTGLPVGVGIGSLPVTPNRNGEIGVLCVESGLAGVPQHNKYMENEMKE